VTERLYYTDASLVEFDAQVLQVVEAGGGRPALVLDRTAFYPSSGGQPFDTGTIDGVPVIDVIDQEDGTILHVVEAPVGAGPVHGRVDRDRRFDHMQQHTGQHVLSAVFDRVAQAPTASFHLGSEASTIDLTREVSPQEIERAEQEANRVVWADRPVTIRFAEADEAARLPLRREPGRQGMLRLVEIEGCDLSACGGTHVSRTGAIGMIAVGSTERFRGGTRVEFFCGSRALRSVRQLRAIISACTRTLSVAPADLPEGIERVQEEARALRRSTARLQAQLAASEAVSLRAQAEPIAGTRFAIAAIEGRDAAGLKQLASAIVSGAGCAAVLVSVPAPSFAVVARSFDVPLDAGAFLKKMIARFGGRGGGRTDFAQGGGLDGSPQEMLAHARTLASGW
jgi:alanyl-tRNA synthetase